MLKEDQTCGNDCGWIGKSNQERKETKQKISDIPLFCEGFVCEKEEEEEDESFVEGKVSIDVALSGEMKKERKEPDKRKKRLTMIEEAEKEMDEALGL